MSPAPGPPSRDTPVDDRPGHPMLASIILVVAVSLLRIRQPAVVPAEVAVERVPAAVG